MMGSPDNRRPLKIQAVLDRFVTACQADERIVAAFLGGSYARDAADEFSDLDLYVITTDKDFNDFSTQRAAFVRRLGEPIFVEAFDLPNFVFFILAEGTEGELGIGRVSLFNEIHTGPYKVLLDKQGVLEGAVFPARAVDPLAQAENLRRLIDWFWHDISHFITALGRGQLWWAQGQLEVLRRAYVSLARLRNDFSDADIGDEAYFKLDQVTSPEQLSALQAAFPPLDAEALLQAGLEIVRFYQELARPLAQAHGIGYPEALERVMVHRLENLSHQNTEWI